MRTKPGPSPEATTTRRLGRRISVLAIAVAALMLAGCLNDQGVRSFDLVNADRGANGLGELANDFDLNAIAQEWSDHMAATGNLAHSGVDIPAGSTRVAENVGYASSVDRVHQLFMGSSGHRDNILNRGVTRVGIGATVDADGTVWITQIFAN